jgi:hypothetical protein
MGTLGIAKGLPTLKTIIKAHSKYVSEKADKRTLEQYAQTGDLPKLVKVPFPADWVNWESGLVYYHLSAHGYELSSTAWARLGTTDSFDQQLMTQAYVARSFLLWVSLYYEARGPERYVGLARAMPSFGVIMPFEAHEQAAQGFALGCRDLATRQAKMLIEAYRRNMFTSIECYPLDYMILRVLCDWLGQPQANWHPVAYESPIMNAVVEHWRTTDLDKLAVVLDDACDYHTHRYKIGTSGGTDFREFGNQWYARYPVETLMILRLRSYLCLENPEIDHPLVKDPPGQLPPAQPPVMDELTRAVYQRMKSQGFDEETIYRMFVPAGD